MLEKAGILRFNQLYLKWAGTLTGSKWYKKRKYVKDHKPSKKFFSELLKEMYSQGYITKDVDTCSKLNNKPTLIGLTQDARKLIQMNILKLGEKQEIFKKIYEKILLGDFFQKVYEKVLVNDEWLGLYEKVLMPSFTAKELVINSELEFDGYLGKLNLKKDRLNWGRWETLSYGRAGKLVYSEGSSARYLREIKRDYWKDKKGQSTVHEEIRFSCEPIRDQLDFLIWKLEKWIMNRKGKSELSSREFHIFIPGISIQEIDEKECFKEAEIEEGISTLLKAGLLRKYLLGSEVRYVIADSELLYFFGAIRELFISEINYLIYKWKILEPPTEIEMKRFGWVFGSKNFKLLSVKLESELVNHKRLMNVCKNVDEYNEIIKHQDADWKRLGYDHELEMYKGKRETQPQTIKEHKQDIKNYREYIKTKQVESMKLLPVNYENEGLEDIKMEFKEIIEKYPFLRHIVSYVCPRVFEPADEKLQKAIVGDEIEKLKVTGELADELEAIDYANAYDRKNKRKIPFEIIKVRNARTGKVMGSKVLNLGEHSLDLEFSR